MKKLIKIAAVLLAIGVILGAGGAYWIRKDNVNPASIYGILEKNLKLNESNFSYISPEPPDLSKAAEKSEKKHVSYGLNEFNTLSIYSENCEVELTGISDEVMTVNLGSGSLVTSITGGRLCVVAIGDNKGSEISIGVPDIYKGGFDIKGKSCAFNAEPLESAMDMSFNLEGCSLEAESLSADSIIISSSGSSIRCGDVRAIDGLTFFAESTELNASSVSSPYTSLTVNNSTVNMKNISGGFKADAQLTTLGAQFSEITGNITLDIKAGSAELSVPKSSPLTIKSSESYAVFNDKTNPAQNSDSDKAIRYTMETNIKFGIVTLTELE